jgi:uncharacterized protein (TIGR02118 family)
MIKSIVLAHRKPGLTREEFNRYWLEQHAPLAARLIPHVRKYVQNHLVEIPGREYQGDGIVEIWYDDLESFRKSRAFIMSAEGKELADDGKKFCQLKGGGEWIVEEHVIKDDLKK